MGCNCGKNSTAYKAQGGSYNILNALADTARMTVGIKDKGDVLTNYPVEKERLKICFACDRLINLTKSCRECGCFVVAKAKFQKSSCPLGKWGPVDSDNNPIQPETSDNKEEQKG